MIFPKDFPDKLRSSILVSEVVGKKVKLKSHGKEFTGLCPFHNEKTPSFTVNDQKGFYHCFGCGAHGDVVSFVMNNEGLEFKDAVNQLADDYGIPIPQVEFSKAKDTKLDRDYLILEKICAFFEKNLIASGGNAAMNYLQKRGISPEIIRKFRLGFAMNSYDHLLNYLKSETFTDAEISRTGVIGVNDRKTFYDKFRNRVIFPITDKKNRVIAFGGRTIGDDMPKYLNSAETTIFKKNQTLYNLFFARKPIFSKKYAVVVEGYMDAISLSANGVENVVAGLGTALGAEHLKELFYITDRVVICLDGDSAGVRAAKRVSEIVLPLVNTKKNLAFTFLPNQLDPDDFIKEYGALALEKAFANATPLSQSLFDFTLSDLGVDANDKISAEIKAKIEADLFAKIEAIQDATSKKYFSFFFKDLLFALGRKSGKNFKNTPENPNVERKFSLKRSDNAQNILAKNIIALLIKFPELIDFHNDDCDIRDVNFVNEDMTHLKESVIDLIESNPDKGCDGILAAIATSCEKKDASDLKNLLASIKSITLEFAKDKISILLLKDSLLQVEVQYKEALSKIDDIQTHQSAITDQKIREIFEYKKSLENKILTLEKELI